MRRLFEPFVQVDSSLSKQYRGTGLGLSLVYRLVRLHGGGVRVESRIGEGSRFEVSLPWGQEQEIGCRGEAEGAGPTREAARAGTILLAEDHQASTRIHEQCLHDRGYRVIVSRTGPETLQWVQEERPDLIVVDTLLPGLSGTRAVSQLLDRRDPSALPIPIIAISDLSFPGDHERWLAAGASLFLTQPLSPSRLSGAVTQLLGAPPEGAETGSQAPRLQEDQDANVI